MRTRRVVTAILMAAVVSSRALAAGPEEAAKTSAEAWLALVDQQKYSESWDQISRKLKSSQYTDKLSGAPDGRYVVIRYDTVFEKKAQAVETITPMADPDGAWRVSGYFLQ